MEYPSLRFYGMNLKKLIAMHIQVQSITSLTFHLLIKNFYDLKYSLNLVGLATKRTSNDKKLRIPFKPLYITFENIMYSVDTPNVSE